MSHVLAGAEPGDIRYLGLVIYTHAPDGSYYSRKDCYNNKLPYVLKEVTAIRGCAPLHGSNIVLMTLVCQSDNKLMTKSLKNMVLIYLLVQTACI